MYRSVQNIYRRIYLLPSKLGTMQQKPQLSKSHNIGTDEILFRTE